MKIKEYIESGILEAYVLGSASEAETRELLSLKARYPEVREALAELEYDLERIAENMAIIPPPATWHKIEAQINELMVKPDVQPLTVAKHPDKKDPPKKPRDGQFIEVEGESSHMRVHKVWRWILAAIFLLGKVFLAFAIYYYLENRQAKIQIEKLQHQLEQQDP